MPSTKQRTDKSASRKRSAAKRSQRKAPTKVAPLTPKIVLNALGAKDPAVRHNSLEAIRRATPAEREQCCPEGYAGKCRTRFIEEGLIMREQIALNPVRQFTTKSEEDTMPAKSTATKSAAKSARTRKGQQTAPKSTRSAKRASQPSVEITAAAVARDAEIDGTEFRKFLRSQGIRKGGITDKRHAARLVKAFRKQVAA